MPALVEYSKIFEEGIETYRAIWYFIDFFYFDH